MPSVCKICGVRGEKDSKISLHTFPVKKPEMNIKWCTATGLDISEVRASTRICARHFKPVDFWANESYSYKRRLKSDAVPSLFLNVDQFTPDPKPQSDLLASTTESTDPTSELAENENPALSQVANRKKLKYLSRGQLIQTIKILRHKMKLLQMKLRRKDLVIAKERYTISGLQKKLKLQPDALSFMEELFQKGSCKVIVRNENQIRPKKKQKVVVASFAST